MDLHLDLGEGNHVDPDAAAALGEDAGQVQHLFQGAVAGIGVGVEMHRADLHATLGDHPARHRAVDAAREQQRCPAIGTHRHTAHRGDHPHIQVGQVADLHIHGVVRVLHVHLQVGIGAQDAAAHLGVDLGGIHEIPLVAAAGRDLEGTLQPGSHVHRLLADGLKVVLGHFDGGTHAVDAKDLGHPADALLQVGEIGNENAAVVHPHIAAQILHRVPDLLDQLADKVGAVQALEEDLAISNQQQLAHGNSPIIV